MTLYTKKLKFYNLKTKKRKRKWYLSTLKELKAIGLNYSNDNLEIYQLKLDNDLRTLTKKYKLTWNIKGFNFINYYRDLNLIFAELNEIWYYQNTSYLIEYHKLSKSNPVPNNQVVGKLINNLINLHLKIIV